MKKRISIICILILTLVIGHTNFALAATSSTAKPKAPKMNSAVLAEDGSIDVVWSKVSGADKYEIYRATSKSGTYKKIATVNSKNRTYNDTDVKDYKTYYYKVKAVDEGMKSSYSTVVSAFVEGVPSVNDTMELIFRFDNGDRADCTPSAGMLLGDAAQFNCTFKYKGKATSDYELYYDKENLKITKGEKGKLSINVKKAGSYRITFEKNGEKGTFGYNAYLAKHGPVEFEWTQENGDQSSKSVKIPKYSESVLTIKYKGKAIKDFTITSSNKNVCTVKKSGSKVTVTNQGPGKCNITVTYKGQKTVFQWMVKRGLATSDINVVHGVPVSKSVSKKDAEVIINTLTTPQYTKKQIQQFAKDDLSLNQWAKKISTPADAIQMLKALNYNEIEQNLQIDNCTDSNITRTNWIFDYSAEQNFDLRYGACAGTSNLMNRFLMDTFDEMGYVLYCNSISGGHIINYFKINDVYVMCDFIGIPGMDLYHGDYPADTKAYIVYMTCNLEDFTEYYKKCSPVGISPNPSEGEMAYMALYKYKGDPLPTGYDYDDSTVFVLPKEYEDCYDILFIKDGCSVDFRSLETAVIPSFRKDTLLH